MTWWWGFCAGIVVGVLLRRFVEYATAWRQRRRKKRLAARYAKWCGYDS